MSEPITDDVAQVAPPASQVPVETVEAPPPTPTIEQRLMTLEAQTYAVKDALEALLTKVSAPVVAVPAGLVRYDGPSDAINIDIRKGETFLATPRIETLLAPLQARGHIFTPVS